MHQKEEEEMAKEETMCLIVMVEVPEDMRWSNLLSFSIYFNSIFLQKKPF
jgi:hypothetical protein